MHTLTLPETCVVVSASAERAPGVWPKVSDGPILASYCSHRDHHGDVVFDAIYFGVYWSIGAREDLEACLQIKRDMHLRDVCVAVQGGYPGYMAGATFDFRGELEKLTELCRFILDRGLRPVIYLMTADGGTEKEIYNGQLSRACQATKEFVGSAWYNIGWEVDRDRGGAFTAGQSSDALLVCRRELGEQAMLAWHGQPNRTTPASYWGSDYHHRPTPGNQPEIGLRWVGDDPTTHAHPNGAWIDEDDPSDGSEQGAFYCEGTGFAEIDVILFQTDHGAEGPSYPTPGGDPGLDAWGQPRWWGRTLECLDRFLPAGTAMPGATGYTRQDDHGTIHVHPGVAGAKDSAGYAPPDWFHSPRRRGRPQWVIWETVAYEFTRDQCCGEAVARCSLEASSFSAPGQGCWQ